jgi:pimeloyl-ACP methyl ester carboxylesterase
MNIGHAELWAAAGAALAIGHGSLYALFANLRWPADERIKVKGGRIHVRRFGDQGPAIVLVHGAFSNARDMDEVAKRLADGFRVFAIDRPGHGHSSHFSGARHIGRQATVIAAAMTAADAAPGVVVAHGLGCATALRLALDYPDHVSGLVLLAPVTHPHPGGPSWAERCAALPLLGPLFVRLAIPLGGPIGVGAALRSRFAPSPPPQRYRARAGLGLCFRPKAFRAGAREAVATRRSFEEQYFRYPEIEAPTVIIASDRDQVAAPAIHARALARELPRAETVTTPGAGHMPHQLRPDAVAAAVRRVQAIGAGAAKD